MKDDLSANWALMTKQAHIDIAEGRKTINEVRMDFGLEPIDGGDVLTQRYVVASDPASKRRALLG